ncbi:division plane positioning ATPase MipZ [Caulobacter sp. 17J80-11]|uniref:division plane positioning ATPase MipZ n=1 Tax=Caulobacter sp. 17J80-11 TaxID=2763502 RepID=UPI00165392AB|nr:AAA family ATPase [Caulobacter sp. 17J80-11]
MSQSRVIVIGNEKGGAGKSTIAMHLATGLGWGGASVAIIDLDLRQQSLGRFLANRRTWLAASNAEAPMPLEFKLGEDTAAFASATAEAAVARFEEILAEARAQADHVVIDTPGADTPLSRAAHAAADLIVTPMNDSFVDFDLLGQVDPVSFELVKPSIYSESVWEARKLKAQRERKMADWVVLRNRLAPTEAKNRRRVEERMAALSKKVGFRIGPGLRDRVIYRELFPFGLTVADLSSQIRPVAVSLAHVAARQELRSLMKALNLGELVRDEAA